MTDKNIFEAIITLPSDNTTMLLEGLKTIRQYTKKVELLSDGKGRVVYKVKVNDLLENDITEDDIKKLRNGSWKIEDDYLVKDM